MDDAALAVGRGLASARSVTRGVVRVTTSQVAATWLLPAVLARLQRVHPEIEIELVASNELTNLLRREADIAVRMVRPAQSSLIAKKLGEIEIVAAAHKAYLAKAPPLRDFADLAAHRLIGYDRDETIVRGAASMGIALRRADFALRTDDQVAYGRLVAEAAGVALSPATTCATGQAWWSCCRAWSPAASHAGSRCTARSAPTRWCGRCTTSSPARSPRRSAERYGRRNAATSGRAIGRTLSYARAARSTSASPNIGPTSCRPIGRPSLVRPHGIVHAGCCVRLNG
jgi:Transcriptional regulator